MTSIEDSGPPKQLALTAGTSAWLNNLIACSISIFLNSVATWVLMCSKNLPHLLKVVVLILKLLEISFSALFIVACPVFAAIEHDEFSALMIVNVGVQLDVNVSTCLLMLSLVLLTQQIFTSPITYFIRYLQICRKGVHLPEVMFILVTNVVLLVLSVGFLCYASLPTTDDLIVMSSLAVSYVGHQTAFLVLSYDKSITMIPVLVSGITYCIILLLSIVVMLFCYFRINATAKSSPNMSDNLMRLQKRGTVVLMTQFLITIIFIQVPFFYSVLGPLVGASQGLATYLVSILFVWGPVANAVMLYVFKTEVRRMVFRCAKDADLNVIAVVENRSTMKSF